MFLKFKILLFIMLVMAFARCTPKAIISETKSSEMANIAIVDPYVHVSAIDKGNKTVYNQQYADSAKNNVINGLKERFLDRNIQEVNLDSVTIRIFYKEMTSLIRTLEKSKKGTSISPTLDSLLTSQQIEYSMFFILDGFTRSSKNYANQTAKGALVAVATLGMLYTVPTKATSTLRLLIIDNKQKNVAFYKSNFRATEPILKKMTDKQLDVLFKGYLPEKVM